MPYFDLFYDQPIILIVLSFILASAIVYATDFMALPAAARLKYAQKRSPLRLVVELVARLPIIAFIFAFFFVISWRPIYSGFATASFFVIFTAISRIKFKFIREPLLFSDIALVFDVFKYKTIFYATKFNILFWVAALSYVFGLSALYMVFEPHILPATFKLFWVFVGLAAFLCLIALLFVKPVNRLAATLSERLLKTLKVRPNTVRFGTFTSVALHFLVWLGKNRDVIVNEMSQGLHRVIHDLIDSEHHDAPLIIVWQSESFYDLRHMGDNELQLPTIDSLKERAVQWGRLTNVFEGGYTLRTEFAVLSGLKPDEVHIDASYPYLRAGHYADVVWPNKLLRNDWHTHFIHPYDRTFFMRHKALPLLGFEHMTMLDEFDHQPTPANPYVSDMDLTHKVLHTIGGIGDAKPSLVFVASMANHGPWEPERCAGLTEPVEIYRELMRRADEALGTLIDVLDKSTRPVWLAFYGDHAPLLKSYADPFPDPRTDYFIVPLGAARAEKPAHAHPREEAPWNLFETILLHAKLYKERFA
ncbi:LTA synthase family protein [Agrobacterium sp. rho-13.3]|uniref:LTA synthase family protein n=1 Tax=Agrobacterium sp. rho-13.3 TaxID=3072980 RepID=UPI002A162EF0|nr:sulfatase-like hydrolase/transferase [Agrobacterium sp. rho-13.3]MDX8311737.1 sulfatase-like hydrolase/transferase [Agrobacterium sp. rho-13.3]